ncbi:MAG: hypothetical protein M0T84_15315 [Betaproteobacteria bacterium]|nr:hypothetical protein [Betaproteobacteria bacterium]
MNNLQKRLVGSLVASALVAMPICAALAQQLQPSAATDSSAGYGPMGYGYGPHYGMGPGMMGYGYRGYGMGQGMMGGWGLAGLDLSSTQIDKLSGILTNLARTQSTLRIRMFKARLTAQEQINAVLTKEQRAALQNGWGGWRMMGY